MRRQDIRTWLVSLAGLVILAVLTGAVLGHTDTPGPLVRSVQVGKHPVAIAVSVQTGRAFVVNSDSNTVSVLDIGSGQLLSTVAVGIHPSAVTVDERDGCVVVANQGDGSLSVLNARGGRLLHTVTLHRDAYGVIDFVPQALAVDDGSGRVFVTGNGGRIGVLDGCASRVARTVGGLPSTASGGTVSVDRLTGGVFVVNNMDPGTGSTVSVLDGRRAAPASSVLVSQGAQDVAADARAGNVFVVGPAGLNVLDERRGRVARTIPVRAMYGETVLDERRGRLFVGTISGGLTALDTHSGRVLYTRSLGIFPGSIIAEDKRRGRLYVCMANNVLRLDARDGARLGVIPVRGCDGGMVVDERTGFVFAGNNDDTVGAPPAWAWLPAWLRTWLPRQAAPESGTGSVSVLDPTR